MPPVTTKSTASDSQGENSLKERRFKLSRACDRCRRRRIKCDEGHPCQACLTANAACTFEEPGKRSHPHKSKRTTTLEDRMHHLETLIQAIPPAVFAADHLGAQSWDAGGPSDSHKFPSGVPPPSLHSFPLLNPSAHFKSNGSSTRHSPPSAVSPTDQLAEDTARLSVSASYMYFDDEGFTRWQGETSGLPLLDFLVERTSGNSSKDDASASPGSTDAAAAHWFPNRTARRANVDPQTLWHLITSAIPPDLMDSLVQCYLSTSYYLMPFLHVPTFLADYGHPQKWGEPGFAAFIVSICCLASRHIDDPRVRADPNSGVSSGAQWFDLLARLRTLPMSGADRPTLYTIQSALVAAVYAVGLGALSRAAALLADAVALCFDAGLHRNTYDYETLFDPVEDEVRKRTFWCVYLWDKQLAAHFGRPPVLRFRDCDVGEPREIDDEYITREGYLVPPPRAQEECRMSAFVRLLRITIVLESVVDVPPPRHPSDSSPFLMHASATLFGGPRRLSTLAAFGSRTDGFGQRSLREEEAMLDEIRLSIPSYWAHVPESTDPAISSRSNEPMSSEETVRLTQAERLYTFEQFVRLLIHRQRFSEYVTERTSGVVDGEMTESEKEAMVKAHNCALQIITAQVHIAAKGLMTYYGVHVIHQLTQAGRTLVAVLLNCKSEAFQHLIPPGLDALRSCVGLLRRFSGRYICGLRSGDVMEEFCRLTGIPLEPLRQEMPQTGERPAWIRPLRKKSQARSSYGGDGGSQHDSPGDATSTVQEKGSFTPSDLFTASPGDSGQHNNNVSSPSMQARPHNGLSTASSPSTSFGGSTMGMDRLSMDLLRADPHMYMSMSPADVMALFSHEPDLDVSHLSELDMTNVFSPDYLHSAAANVTQAPPANSGTGSSTEPAAMDVSTGATA
ncbi:hypothetical protein FISHEDRAFT_43345 [Fistulina hepatica ATCC 64428]|uniref:Zn(2)-C6 fungal-type domain-containing protein n=1 Tax=Fistulina hepatica ATCC 64428 TaxID=1128425 RepID=A0A0D7AF02_9AGAR|nr:hypothetical protein FISHEDRAFT_43345 [Fistulina hepatica ATCC 64428]